MSLPEARKCTEPLECLLDRRTAAAPENRDGRELCTIMGF